MGFDKMFDLTAGVFLYFQKLLKYDGMLHRVHVMRAYTMPPSFLGLPQEPYTPIKGYRTQQHKFTPHTPP